LRERGFVENVEVTAGEDEEGICPCHKHQQFFIGALTCCQDPTVHHPY
jgi:hypothetical protein